MLITATFAPNESKEYSEENDFFRVLEANGLLTLIFYFNGKEVSRAENIKEGFAEKFLTERFNKVLVTNKQATAQDIQFVARLGHEVEYNKTPVGDVNITNTTGAFGQSQKTVTNTSTQLLAAKPERRYFLIQNNDASGDVYVTLDGTAATTAKGIKIAAGGSYECQNFNPSGAIFAIGSIASNANVVTVEG
jgi:hypothetical protein